MMGQRLPLLLLLAVFAGAAIVSPLFADGAQAQTGQSTQAGSNAAATATAQSTVDSATNPFFYPYGADTSQTAVQTTVKTGTVSSGTVNSGTVNSGAVTSGTKASGIYAGVNTGAYTTLLGNNYLTSYNPYSGGYGMSTPYIGTPYGVNVGGGYSLGSTYAGGYTAGSNYAGNYGLTYGTNYAGSTYGYGYNPTYGQSNVAATYASGSPYLNYGYGGGYGYGGSYGYGMCSSLVPGIAGAAVGALLGKHFGVIGLIAGGVGGFVVGSWLGSQATQMPYYGMYDNYNAIVDANVSNRYAYQSGLNNYYYGRCTSSSLGIMPGLAGAALGLILGKHCGLTGMLVGGVVGFIGGQLLGKMLFPQNYYNQYGSYYQDPYNNINNFRSATLPGSLNSNQTSSGGVVVKTYAPSTTTEDATLSKLRATYFDAMDTYQKALGSGTTEEKTVAKQAFEDAQSKYMKAKATVQESTAASQ